MIIELSVSDNKAKSFISFLEELDFVKINSKTTNKEKALTDADIIFGTGKPVSKTQLKNYLVKSDTEEVRELSVVCEDVIAYIDAKKG